MKRFLTFLCTIAMLLCIAVPSAFADYENTHSNTGDHAADLLSVALTQIGYQGDKYLQQSTGDRNAAFIAWCAYEAGIGDDAIPKMASTEQLYSFFLNGKMLHSSGEYEPKKGDIVFFGENETASGCGIFVSVDNIYGEDYVTAILCSAEGSVQKKQYKRTYEKLLAFASPDYTAAGQYKPGEYRTTASYLNFRTAPTVSSEAICQIPMGTRVTVTEISGEWGKITYNEVTGWINMQYAAVYEDNHKDTSDYAVNWNVIDVSRWQGDINWDKVANADIQGAILRIGLRGTKTKAILIDERFEEYYNGAKRVGLPVGCYFYSAAESAEEAREEAYFILDKIQSLDLKFEMPVYLDMEADVIEKNGKEIIQTVTTTFLDVMDAAGVYAGVYCSTYWANDYYYDDNIIGNHPLWIADWREECAYAGDYGMWQFTEKGSVSGIEANYTDLNICYVDYPTLIADIAAGKFQGNGNEPHRLGDVNGDGDISATDARLTLRIAANLTKANEKQFAAADVDSDQTVTASDARKILRVAAGLDRFS